MARARDEQTGPLSHAPSPQGPHSPLEKIRCHTEPVTAGRKSRRQRDGALGVVHLRPRQVPQPHPPPLPSPAPPAPEPILMRPLCCMKMVSLVRFPWMMGGLQACRKLGRRREQAELGQGCQGGGGAEGRCSGKPRPSPERGQDLRAPALPGLAADGLRGMSAGKAAGPEVPRPSPAPVPRAAQHPLTTSVPSAPRPHPVPDADPAHSLYPGIHGLVVLLGLFEELLEAAR